MSNYPETWQSWTRVKPKFPLSFHWETNPLPQGKYVDNKIDYSKIKDPVILWNSWTSYGTDYTSADLLSEAAKIKESNLPVSTIVADEGWCTTGDCDRADDVKIPGDIDCLAEELGNLGFNLGLWFAPYLVAGDSEIAREHPDWLVRDSNGDPLSGIKNNPLLAYFTPRKYHLNSQLPQVKQHIYREIDGLVKKGVTLFKLDFLHLPYFEPGLEDDSIPFHTLVELFQYLRSKHPHVFTIACGCPFAPARGMVDAIRVGPDSTWPPSSAPQWLRRIVYRIRKVENETKLSLFPAYPRRPYGLDPDVIMYPHEWDKAYSKWLDHEFEVLGIGYSLLKQTL